MISGRRRHRNRWSSLALCLVALLFAGGCGGDEEEPQGDITIQAGDEFGPEGILLQAAEVDGSGTVQAGGPGSSTPLALRSRTATLNLLASATDEQSGIQSLQIWIRSPLYVTCAGLVCTNHGPGLVGGPAFETTEPKKGVGELDFKTTALLAPLNVSQYIPANATRGQFDVSVDAYNNVGLVTSTGTIRVRWP